MPKITDRTLIRRVCILFKDDYSFLQQMYGDSVGVNRVLRTLVHTYCNQVRAEADQKINQTEALRTGADEEAQAFRLKERLAKAGVTSISELIAKEQENDHGVRNTC